MEFKDLNLLDFGHKIMASGIIYTDGETDYALYFPNEILARTVTELHPTIEEWEALLKQTDDVMVMNSLTKAYVKKSQRNIEQSICWKVYGRDSYTCRYCNRTGIPLTVDHVDLWENGGATTEANLITACKQCNRDRGNMPYPEWLNSSKYAKHSAHLPDEIKQKNLEVVNSLPQLEQLRITHARKR